MLGLVILVFIAFTSRILAIKGAPQNFDTYGHLYFAKELSSQKVGPFGSISMKVLGGKQFSTPFIWHWIVGLFSIEFVSKYQKLWNPTLDAIFSVGVYLIALRLGFEQVEALLCYSLYLLTPMWFSRISSGPRVESLTPRLSGEIITNIFFAVVCLPLGLPLWVTAVIGGICAFYVLGSSKFGVQALLFLTPIISVFSFSIIPALCLILGGILLAIVSKGAFLNSVSGQLRHLKWFFLGNLNDSISISGRNKFDGKYKKRNKEGARNYIVRVLVMFIGTNSYTGVLIKLPILILVLLGAGIFSDIDDALYIYMVPVWSAFILFLLINLQPLLFLGEAERYLNHVALFIVLAAVNLFSKISLESLLFIILIYGAIYLLIEAFVLPRVNKRPLSEDKEADQVITFLKNIDETIVLTYPYHAGGGVYRIMAETPHKTIYPILTSDTFFKKFEKKYGSQYPFFNLCDLERIQTDLDVTVLVVNKLFLESNIGLDWKPPVDWSEIDLGLKLHQVYIHKSLPHEN
jgi:hypothetical protein